MFDFNVYVFYLKAFTQARSVYTDNSKLQISIVDLFFYLLNILGRILQAILISDENINRQAESIVKVC